MPSVVELYEEKKVANAHSMDDRVSISSNEEEIVKPKPTSGRSKITDQKSYSINFKLI